MQNAKNKNLDYTNIFIFIDIKMNVKKKYA